MFAKLAAFAAGPWGALVGKAMMILTVVALIYVAVGNYNESIRATERAANRNAQLEQVLKDNREFRTKLDDLEKKSDQIIAVTKAKNDKVEETHTTVNRYITSPDAQKSNRPSSDVIKHTIGMLHNED